MATQFQARVNRVVASLPEELRKRALDDVAELQKHSELIPLSLLEILEDRSLPRRIRSIAAWVAGAAREESLTGVLKRIVERSEPPDLRWEAAKALCSLGRGAQLFRGLLRESPNPLLRRIAAYALGRLGDQAFVPDLCKTLDDVREDPEIRGQAAEALAYIGDESALECLMNAASDTEVEVRFWAAFALGHLGDRRAEPVLTRIKKEDRASLPGWGSVANEASKALERIRGDESRE